ncbi:hypothetical protein G1H11_18665 [Phytoactinopolyspora alkaliphila]|uniref:ESX secretion-associated protein EspG n=1 Tax=Phytoactinopolyspora alkaliphila TaxID=1783498 RepID=A0A6N9YQN0_9ACTN|nr:hypothetical protein [Phytoactinopolyspora alkaliphila]NED97323.1 hypothetical protein [Phytoactinopolyspora alkaliphila]
MNDAVQATADTGAAGAAGAGEVTFTAHELLALLEWRPGPEAELSRDVLRLPATGVDQLAVAGNATLMVRDMFRTDGDEPGPAGAASVVGYALTAAQRCTSLTFGEPDVSRVVLVMESEKVALILTPRVPELFDAVPLPTAMTSADVVPGSVSRFLDHPGGRVVRVEVVTARGRGAMTVGAESGGRWWAGDDDGARRDVAPGELRGMIDALVSRS